MEEPISYFLSDLGNGRVFYYRRVIVTEVLTRWDLWATDCWKGIDVPLHDTKEMPTVVYSSSILRDGFREMTRLEAAIRGIG